ncbi:PA14 domain-containing protein [Bacillus cereus]
MLVNFFSDSYFSKLSIIKCGPFSTFISKEESRMLPAQKQKFSSIRWLGYITVPKQSEYIFSTSQSANVRILINDISVQMPGILNKKNFIKRT